jgi:hypothetical protein
MKAHKYSIWSHWTGQPHCKDFRVQKYDFLLFISPLNCKFTPALHVVYALNLRRIQASLFWERLPLSLNTWAYFAYCCELCGEESTSFTQLSNAQWLLYLPTCSSKNSTFCPHNLFISFLCLAEQTAIIFVYSGNWLNFINDMEYVYGAVGFGHLNMISVDLILKWLTVLCVISFCWRCQECFAVINLDFNFTIKRAYFWQLVISITGLIYRNR